MARCDTSALADKACTGKCKAGACTQMPRIWVLAACGGVIALLEKKPDGALVPLEAQAGTPVFASLEQFHQSMDGGAFDQLIIVGSKSDVGWAHAALPAARIGQVVAEIEYPLLPAWLKQPAPMPQLVHALENVFR